MKTKKPRTTRAQLRRRVQELEAQLVHVYHFADATLGRASMPHCMGSAVIVQLTALGGQEIINPVAIRDGLSDETIEALRADIRRSYERAVELAPRDPEGEKK